MMRPVLSALLGHWRRKPLQLAALLVGLALATGLWTGVQAINAEARGSYDAAASVLGQDRLDRLRRADGRTIPIESYLALRRAGWLVSPVIEGRLQSPAGPLRLLGLDALTAPPRAGLSEVTAGGVDFAAFVQAPGLLLAAPETAARLEGTDLPPVEAVDGLPPGTILADIGVAAGMLEDPGIAYLLVAETQPLGIPPLDGITTLQRVPPETGADLGRLTGSFHLNLTAFGFLAFAVGLFIVNGQIGLAFEQRRPVFRTLRALGVPLPRLIALLAAELAVIAVAAGLAGIALGYVIAGALMPGVAATLRSLYGADVAGGLGFDPVWAGAGLGIALLGTALAGGQALWRVAGMPILAPAQPRAWAMATARALRVQTGAGIALLLLALVLGLFGGSLVMGFACLAALLLGAALVLPAVLTAGLAAAQRLARTPMSEWTIADARQQVPGLSLALMALLLALAANIGVGTMVGSFRATFTGYLDQRLASELYVATRDATQADAVADWLRPRSDAVLPIVFVEADLAGQSGDLFGLVDHPTYRENWPLLDALPDVWDRVAEGEAVLINEQLSRRGGLGAGDMLDLRPGWRVEIAGVYSDYGNLEGQAIIALHALLGRHPEVTPTRFAVRIDPGQAETLATELAARFDLPPDGIVDQASLKALSLRIFERTFLVTGALNVLTLGVAAFAILTALLTLSSMRLPQLAPVWALGQTRQRLALLEVARAVALAALTWAVAIPVGLALAWVLLAVVNVEAFGWRLPMQVFPLGWLSLGGWTLLAAILAAGWPSLSLARRHPVHLLRVFADER